MEPWRYERTLSGSSPHIETTCALWTIVPPAITFDLGGVSQTSVLTGNAGLFRMGTLSVSVAFDNGTSNGGNASNIIKCLKRFARCGLARGVIDRLQLHMKFYRYDGEVRESSFASVVRQEADEENMLSCVRRGFCHDTSETLASGPLYNGEAVKIRKEDWCCG
jgi:hypothetical protein